MDGQRFEDIEAYGLERWLGELQQELKDKSYRPSAVLRVWIPKPGGTQRPLGVPTIKDRVAQMTAVVVLEPIFEAGLEQEPYAYRPGRSALDAVSRVVQLLQTGHRQVVGADLSGYFDSIPHAELLKSLARRNSDGAMLHLLKLWLCTAVEEVDERGRTHRTTRNRDEGKGTPQGAPISALLSNLYVRRFVRGWKTLGHQERHQAFIVNYADDLVLCCRGQAQEALAVGWANYFCLGSVSKAYRIVDEHLRYRLRMWLNHKHKVRLGVHPIDAEESRVLGLICLTGRKGSLPWAKA